MLVEQLLQAKVKEKYTQPAPDQFREGCTASISPPFQLQN
jgi:hypothetical protein